MRPHRAQPGGTVDVPGHGNGRFPIEAACGAWGDCQSQSAGTPPSGNPAQQRGGAESNVRGVTAPCPADAVEEPLSETLAQVVPLAPERDGRGHGALTSAPRQDSPADSQDHAGQLWRGEARQTRFNGLLKLIGFSGRRRAIPAFWCSSRNRTSEVSQFLPKHHSRAASGCYISLSAPLPRPLPCKIRRTHWSRSASLPTVSFPQPAALSGAALQSINDAPTVPAARAFLRFPERTTE